MDSTNTTQTLQRRSNSISQASEDSQTAQDFINSQLVLEAEAREVLPYQFDTCTRPLGPLRQLVFSCLTCNPLPSDSNAPYSAAGVCYSCSISCHGEHELVELHEKRDFVCDCGTTRLPDNAPCTLRINSEGVKGGITGEQPTLTNKYNQNYKDSFCLCGVKYDAEMEAELFQCLGLGTIAEGGCGEDWYHSHCLMGLPSDWKSKSSPKNGLETIKEENDKSLDNGDGGPVGFPHSDDFQDLICFKCVEAYPWIKRYAGTNGFHPAVYQAPSTASDSRKRKASEEMEDMTTASVSSKRVRGEDGASPSVSVAEGTVKQLSLEESTPRCLYKGLPPAPSGIFSIVTKESYRDNICHCPQHYALVKPHGQLIEEEETYQPPMSSDSSDVGDGNGSVGSRSLLDRGEAALSNVDRVRAIEGVMVYNHLKEQVKSFLKPFAESGKAVGAEDIKRYFESLRGDADAIRAAGQEATGGKDGDNRKEQSGY